MRTLLIPKQFSQGFSIAVKHLCIMVKCTQHSSNFCLQKTHTEGNLPSAMLRSEILH